MRVRVLIAGLAVALGLAAFFPTGDRPCKKLLQWGWDEPDTALLVKHLPEMERSPFDGCVFGVRHGPGGAGGSFTWQFWGRRRFTRQDLGSAFSDLRALRARRFRELFLRVNVTPGDVGWFQDFSPILANARLAAELARAGNARGILLDTEQYQGRPFELRSQPLASAYGWEAYAAQARMRGREVMTAFQRGYPGLTVFLTFGHSLPWVLSDRGKKPLAATPYGLLAPFLDGLLEAASGHTRVVDGFELSYGYREPAQFAEARRVVHQDVLPMVRAPDVYRQRLRLAFGLWLDYDWRRRGWSAENPDGNYFSPSAFATALRAALLDTDEYVWVYGETPRWWGAPGPEVRVSHTYREALWRGRLAARSDLTQDSTGGSSE
jgi:hypothetical protein